MIKISKHPIEYVTCEIAGCPYPTTEMQDNGDGTGTTISTNPPVWIYEDVSPMELRFIMCEKHLHETMEAAQEYFGVTDTDTDTNPRTDTVVFTETDPSTDSDTKTEKETSTGTDTVTETLTTEIAELKERNAYLSEELIAKAEEIEKLKKQIAAVPKQQPKQQPKAAHKAKSMKKV